MKYSIITPVYNVEKYLRDCIESVIAQTYSDWELILIDDGSTDDSPAICDEYAKKDSRIKSIHVENGGAYRARVLAKEYIEGGYTIGLDSDDMYEPNCLEVVEKARKETDADMIVFGCSDFSDDTGFFEGEHFGYESGKTYTREAMLERSLILKDHPLWNKAVKSSIYINADNFEEKYRLSLGLDYMQVVPIICGIKKAYAISDSLYIYRMRGDSISHNCKFSHIMDNDWLSCEIRKYLKVRGDYSEDIEYALEHSYMDIFISRLYALRWTITTKEKKRINELSFLNSMTNDIGSLVENRGKRALVHYMKRGVWGPNGIIYKVFLKYYVKPLKRKG